MSVGNLGIQHQHGDGRQRKEDGAEGAVNAPSQKSERGCRYDQLRLRHRVHASEDGRDNIYEDRIARRSDCAEFDIAVAVRVPHHRIGPVIRDVTNG